MKRSHIILALVAIPTALGAMMPSEPRLRPELVQQASAERQVRAILRDPASAEFRHLVPGRCGQVNARNAFGGMTGFQRFLITTNGAVLEEQSTRTSFARAWTERNCV